MASKTIDDLTAQTNPPSTSLIEIDDAGASKKCTLAEALKNTAATTTQRGSVLQAAAVPDGSTVNDLLASLRAAGILAP